MQTEAEFKDFIADLKAPWKTMEPDMDTALNILTRHGVGDIKDLELASISEDKHNPVLQFPDWQAEIENTFIHQYGPSHGRRIFQKVVMRLFLLSRDNAPQLH